jgi:3-hydroxy-9,10-secoandrosta-1,3,5(10)-triene-9,17-dione monooxygenase
MTKQSTAEKRHSRDAGGDTRSGFDDKLGAELVERARELRPLLANHAARHEEIGELTSEVVTPLIDLNVFSMAVPRRWGGGCVSANYMAQVALELAKGCPSTSWVVTVMNSNGWMVSTTPDAMQEAVFGSGDARLCGVFSPPGKLVREGDGYRVSGRWPYASGSHHATWAYCPAKTADGEDGVVAIRMSDTTIENTWHVTGMKGSGSDTVVAANAPVAASCYVSMTQMLDGDRTGNKHFGEATDYWPALPLLRAKVLGVLVGIAEALLETVVETTKGRPVLQTTYARKSDSQAYQVGIGEASARIAGARVIMDQTTRRIDAAALARQPMSYAQRTEIRALGALAVDMLATAVDQLMTLGGSGVFAQASIAQRYWRDFSIGSRHTALIPAVGYEVHGRQVLQVEPNILPLPMI